MPARFRNDHGEDRIVPTLGYSLVAEGEIVPVPDEEAYHWAGAGWTALDPYDVPFALRGNFAHDPMARPLPDPDAPAAPPPAPAAAPAPIPAPVVPAAAPPAPEGVTA